jgi:hypothetical protein
MLRTAILGVSIGSIPPAIADEGASNFTQPPSLIAQAPAQGAPSDGAAQSGHALQPSRGPWLFPPMGKYLDLQGRG